MKSYTLNILWTGLSDATPHQRKRSVSVEVPVEGDTADIEDALLSLPWTDHGGIGESRTVRLAAPREALTDDDVLLTAIPQIHNEIEAKVRKEAEQEEASRANRRTKLEEWLGSGETRTPWGVRDKCVGDVRSERHPSYSRDVMNHSLSDEALGWLDGHDDLRQRVEARIAEINATAHERVKAELAASDDERDKARAEQEARDAAKQASADARAAEIAEWAAKHGSARLQEQLAQGLRGWPLYLHERMLADWSGGLVEPKLVPELDNDGETGDALIDPEEDQLLLARRVAEHAVFLDMYPSMDTAFERIEIVPIEFKIDEDDCCEYNGELETRTYVTFSGYRPGSEAFVEKSIRFCCDTND